MRSTRQVSAYIAAVGCQATHLRAARRVPGPRKESERRPLLPSIGPTGWIKPLDQGHGRNLCAMSNIATMFSGGVPAWTACDGPRM
jgi:hypothetical protein